MPSKGTVCKFHGRHLFIDKKLWRKYVRDTGIEIEYTQFVEIIESTIDEAKKWVIREPVGFRFPHKIGNLAINTFKTYGDFKTYTNTRNQGKPIRNFNLHTEGNVYKIQWFHATREYSERVPFWFFVACREFKRSLAKAIKSNSTPVYNTYMQDQFTSKRKK